jgi:tyrosyl-tRNA synthetase
MRVEKGVFFLKDVFPGGLLSNSTLKEGSFVLPKHHKQSAYFGIDLTAGDLHFGHFLLLVTLKRLSLTGFKPIVLLGGGTTKVGDPSGKEKERKLMLESEIDDNFKSLSEKLNFA